MNGVNSIAKASLIALVAFNMGCAPLGGVIVQPPREQEPSERREYRSYRVLNIPNGHLPPPGQCRVWYPGKPPGQQPPPVSCAQALREFRIGTWIVTRPDNKTLEVKEKKNNVIDVSYYLID